MILYLGADDYDALFDINSFHAYSGINAEYLTERIMSVKRLLDKSEIDGSMWMTEIGMSTSLEHENLADDYYN